MKVKQPLTYLMLVFIGLAPIFVEAQTFSLLVPPDQADCSTLDSEFTTGQQYVDSNNGVPYDSWSMLVRWQGLTIPGPTNWINQPAYLDVGQYTGLHVPYPYGNWQRGYSPQDINAVTPVVQLHCFDAGMIMNSWYAPHQATLGGGWNDMYGYAWAPQNRPKAFLWGSNTPAELVLQGDLALPGVDGYMKDSNDSWVQVQDVNAIPLQVVIQYNLFAYIRDISHPNLHPIALLAGVYGNGDPVTGCRYHLGYDYSDGVWYIGTTIYDPSKCSTPYSTVRYTEGYSTNVPFATPKFYRIHFTRSNLLNIVNDINSQVCSSSCPDNGYSTDPDDYVLDYYGVILETTVCHSVVVCGTQLADRQVAAVARAQYVAAFSYHN